MSGRVQQPWATRADTDKLSSMVAESHKDLAIIKATVERLDHRLYGNGQPGDIEKISTQFSTDMERLSARVNILERAYWRYIGGSAAAMAIIKIVMDYLPHTVQGK